MQNISEKSGKHIKQIRKDLKLNQTEFANKLGVTQSYISQLERNNINISLSLFLHYSQLLKLKEISFILSLDGNNEYEINAKYK